MAGIGAGTGAAALTEEDKENAFLFEQWNAMSDEERERAGGSLSKAPPAWKNEMLARYRGAKAAGGSDEALEAAKATTRAEDTGRAVYDSGTLTSRDEATDHSSSDLSKVSTDIASGKVAAPRASAEAIGKRAATSETPVTSEDDSRGVVARGVEDTMASITSNPAVENVLYESGVNMDSETAPTVADVNKVEGYLESSTGSNPLNQDPKKVVKDANELGTWDYIAIGLTALSMVMFAASGGNIPPIDFTAIGGTQGRIAALTEIRKQRDEFRSRMANEQSVREAWEAMSPQEKALYNNDFKVYRKEIGRTYYETSEKSAQDEADQMTQESLLRLQNELGIERDAANTLNQVKLIDANGKWMVTGKQLDYAQQKAMAELLHNQSTEQQAQTIKNIARDTGMSPDEVMKLQVTGKTLAQRVNSDIMSYIDTAAGAVGTVAGAVTPGGTSSDKCKKVTKHTYIPTNKRR